MENDLVIEKLDQVLGGNLEKGETIESYSGKIATSVGENYGSTMIALKITVRSDNGEKRTISTFCKMLPKDEEIRRAFNVKITFIKEITMYVEAIPAMLQFQKEHCVPENDYISHIFPTCYGGRPGLCDIVDDHAVLLMDDMREKNYTMADRQRGVDFNHAKLVMEKLALFHAVPVAIKIKKPEVFQDVIQRAAKYFIFNEDDPKRGESEKSMLNMMDSIMKKIPQLENVRSRVVETCRGWTGTTFPPKREPFSSILHNDLWVNNMLFKHKDSHPTELVFLDFQVTQLNSPFKDVLFFLFTSVQPDELKTHFVELVDIYHSNFCRYLKQLNVDTVPFTKDAAWEEINMIAGSELYHILMMLRVLTADAQTVKDNPQNWFFVEELGGELYRQRMKNVIFTFEERKWI